MLNHKSLFFDDEDLAEVKKVKYFSEIYNIAILIA